MQKLRESEIWAPPSHPLLQLDVFTIRTVPMDVSLSFRHQVLSCPGLQTSVRPYLGHLPYIQFASRFRFTPLILSRKWERRWQRGVCVGWSRWKSGSEDSDRSEGSCPFSTLVLEHSPPDHPTLSGVRRWHLARDLWEPCRSAVTLLY